MDENAYLGPPAQVTWVKGYSGGAKAIDSELSRTAGLNRISALQSTPSPPPSTTPQQNSDSDARRTLESHSSTGRKSRNRRKRSDKQRISSSQTSMPGPFTRETVQRKEKLDRSQMSLSPYLRELMTAVCKAAATDLLRIFFHCMYDKDVSSEDAFCKYGTSKDPADQLGNGVALKTITAFLTWRGQGPKIINEGRPPGDRA